MDNRSIRDSQDTITIRRKEVVRFSTLEASTVIITIRLASPRSDNRRAILGSLHIIRRTMRPRSSNSLHRRRRNRRLRLTIPGDTEA